MGPIRDRGGLQQAKGAGVRWVRFGDFAWDEIEPTRTDPPTYRWGAIDEGSLINAVNNGLEVIGVVQFTPDWAQKYPGVYCGPIKRESLGAFAQFLQALVARYSVPPYNVGYWELGNEPDIDRSLVPARSGYGCWGEVNSEYYGGGYYGEMLKVAYPAIKAADPNAQVLNGGLLLDCDPRDPDACARGSHLDKPPKFLEGILRNGGGAYLDIVNFHAYARYIPELGILTDWGWPGSVTAIPEKAGFLREVLAQYGFGAKPLMNTEAALLCKESTNECLAAQAAYMPRAYADAIAEGLKAQSYFAMINENWWYTGLIRPDLTHKPAYNAFKTASSFLSQATYQGAATGYPLGIAGHAFRQPAGTRVDVVWSADGSARAVDLPAGAKAFDHSGNLISSSGAIQVGYEALYVQKP
jgi:hypothetical protein